MKSDKNKPGMMPLDSAGPVQKSVAGLQPGGAKEEPRGATPVSLRDAVTPPPTRWFPETIFEEPELALAVLDIEGKVSKVSRGAASLLGVDPAEFQGTSWDEWVHPQDRRPVREGLERVLTGEFSSFVFECRCRAKSGDLHWCSMTALPLHDEGRQVKALVLFLLDAAGKRRLDEELREVERQLLVAQKMESLGMLVGGMAHDFNNFLEVILGFASLARLRVSKESDLYEPLQMIEESARRASELTSHLLGLVREDGTPSETTDAGEVLRKVAKIIRRTFDRRIHVETRWDSELPWVRGDARQLEQAILNLAINARDAMPEGGTLTLAATRVRLAAHDTRRPASLPPGDYVRFTVEDTGMGMEPSVLERIFDPLFTTKPAGEGTGLGLTMVRKIVQAAGGVVQARSERDRGTLLEILLPVAEAAPSAATEAPPPVQGRGTVLVVEDEPMVLAFVERGLKQLGYRVLSAENGRKACEIYSQHADAVDCVLLDMVLPEMSGLETYARLKAIRADVRVILSSGYSRERLTGDFAEADFLGKPYSLEALSLAIERILR